MQVEYLNNVFMIISAVFEIISIIIMWLYSIEERKGLLDNQYSVYKKQSDFLFGSSLAMEIVLWFCVTKSQEMILHIIIIALSLWMISLIFFLILSIGKNITNKIKQNIRSAMMNVASKVMILCVIVWILYI